MVGILIYIGISIVVSIVTTTLLLFVYHKKYVRQKSISNNEFQDNKSLETRSTVIEQKLKEETSSIGSKIESGIVESNSHKSFPVQKRIKRDSKKVRNERIVPIQKKEESQVVQRPEDGSFLYFKVSDGKLILSDSISYYRAWSLNNVLYYEFHCDNSKMAKAINNRSVLLEPFCRKETSSEDADNATSIISIRPGTLDKNSYAIIEKTIIKFE